jgi:hypothetical protein
MQIQDAMYICNQTFFFLLLLEEYAKNGYEFNT